MDKPIIIQLEVNIPNLYDRRSVYASLGTESHVLACLKRATALARGLPMM